MTLCNLMRVKGHRNNLKAKEAVPLVTHLYYIDLCGSTLFLKVHYLKLELFSFADVMCLNAHCIVQYSRVLYWYLGFFFQS